MITMPKTKLLNSAMMPAPGIYKAESIAKDEFVHLVQQAHAEGSLESYIGYPQNVELIKQWTGVEVPLNRAQTTVEDGDVLLVMRLKYRVGNPAMKGAKVDARDFEFMRVGYKRR
jgi:hypothetical protein